MNENALYEQLAQYINLQYPGTIYHFDLSGVNNASKYSRALYSRLNGRAWPDLFIAAPQWTTQKLGNNAMGISELTHCVSPGLFIELKCEGETVWLKDGTLTKDKHVREQNDMLERLRIVGYRAEFAVGFDEAKPFIDAFLKQLPWPPANRVPVTSSDRLPDDGSTF